MILFRFVIRDITRELYWNDKNKIFTMFIRKASLYLSYEAAEAELSSIDLPENYYQIDKIFKNKK